MTADKLFESIKLVVPRVDLDQDQLDSYLNHRKVRKGEMILSADQTCLHYYFVNSGSFRIYFYKDGNEYTHWFALEGILFTELESYNLDKPTRYYVEALEDSEVLTISKSKMNELLSKSQAWQEYVRINWEFAFIKLSAVIASFQSKTAKERYEELYEYKELLQKTTQKDLSSMLGITQYSLSRIRKERN